MMGGLDNRTSIVKGPAGVGSRVEGRVGRRIEIGDATFGEEVAVAHIEIALGRQVFRKQNVVAFKLDVPIGHLIDFDLADGRPIDEMAGGDQNLTQNVDADLMARRDEEVAGRPVLAKGMGGDADGPRGARLG